MDQPIEDLHDYAIKSPCLPVLTTFTDVLKDLMKYVLILRFKEQIFEMDENRKDFARSFCDKVENNI